MQNYLQRFYRWFAHLKENERLLMLLGFCLMLVLLWYLIIYSALANKDMQISSEQQNQQQLLTGATKTVQNSAASLAGKQTIAALNKRITALQRQLKTTDQQVELVDVSIQQVGEKITALADQQTSLKVLSLTATAKNVTDKDATTGKENTFIENDLLLTVQGSYFVISNYLKLLQNSGFKFDFKKLTYEVKTYPQAEATIELVINI